MLSRSCSLRSCVVRHKGDGLQRMIKAGNNDRDRRADDQKEIQVNRNDEDDDSTEYMFIRSRCYRVPLDSPRSVLLDLARCQLLNPNHLSLPINTEVTQIFEGSKMNLEEMEIGRGLKDFEGVGASDPRKAFFSYGFHMELVQGATPICEGSCRLTSLERKEVWNDCMSCKVRVGSNGNLLWEAFVLLGRKKDDRGVTEGREDVREVFQQRRSGAKRKLSKCGRNQMGNEPILALPEGADDFVVYYDARSKDLEAGLEKGEEALSERDMESNLYGS
ncbi:hypothetical protein Tco_1523590 [Tanacetum coccineum]